MDDYEDRQGSFGWLLIKLLLGAVGILILGLILDGLGVGWGGYLALGALALGAFVFWVGPWLGPWRR